MNNETANNPGENAIDALSALHDAEIAMAPFSPQGGAYQQALADARKEIGKWANGVVADQID